MFDFVTTLVIYTVNTYYTDVGSIFVYLSVCLTLDGSLLDTT